MKQPRIHRDRQPVFTADGPAAAMHGMFTWSFGNARGEGRTFRPDVELAEGETVSLTAHLPIFDKMLRASAAVDWCIPPSQA